MIVRMSKAEIVGPKSLLLQVLAAIRELEVFHIEVDRSEFVENREKASVTALLPDEKIISERQYLDDLAGKIDELTGYLPQVEVGETFFNTPDIIGAIEAVVKKHLASCRAWARQCEQLREEQAELDRHMIFVEALESLFAGTVKPTRVEFIGITLKDNTAVEPLRDMLEKKTNGSFEIFTTTARDSTLAILLAVPMGVAGEVKELLSGESIPELVFPQASSQIGFSERMEHVKRRRYKNEAEIAELEKKMQRVASHWLAMYRDVRHWISRRHMLLKTTAKLFETEQCFFIYGWVPSEEVPMLTEKLSGTFGGRVLVEEKEIQQREFEKVPVVLRNSPYFRPFEVFTKLLPLPSYVSFDPTLFLGVFFPLFFGLILGDAGYGLLLFLVAIVVRRFYRPGRLIRDLATILLVCSIYATLFGFVFGEFLGELGHAWFGLRPLWLSRSGAVIPMLLFSLSIGAFHVLLGLFLGFLTAVRKGGVGEALFKFAHLLGILCLVSFFIVQNFHVPPGLNKALTLAGAVLLVIAVFSGGLLAPLELLKSIGNIISYARIMAIGLASVLLATVANVLGGMTGDILTGILVAALFHAINIILGVFAPTIQSLRLHFVEFFGKFMEHEGREYQPFK